MPGRRMVRPEATADLSHRASSCGGVALAPAGDRVGRHRVLEALQHEVAEMGCLEPRLDGQEYRLADQHLPGLGLAAKTRSEVRNPPDRRIIEAPVEPDPAERRFSLGDADAEAEVVTGVAPALGERADPGLHVEGHARGALGVVEAGNGLVKKDEKVASQNM